MLDFIKKIYDALREPLGGPLHHIKPGGIPRD